MQVVVTVTCHSGFAIESDADGLSRILRQRNHNFFTRGGDLVIDIIACTAIVPFGGVVSRPSGAVISGDNHEEAVIRLCSETLDGVGIVVVSQRKVESQGRVGQGRKINGRRNQPVFGSCAVNVDFWMILAKYIRVREYPSGRGGG